MYKTLGNHVAAQYFINVLHYPNNPFPNNGSICHESAA